MPPSAVGLGRAQMVKLHVPHQGVETIQESEEKLGLQPLDAWISLDRFKPWPVENSKYVALKMSRVKKGFRTWFETKNL